MSEYIQLHYALLKLSVPDHMQTPVGLYKELLIFHRCVSGQWSSSVRYGDNHYKKASTNSPLVEIV